MVDTRMADGVAMSEHNVCTECGSGSLVVSGVLEQGTWVHRMTCWTCRDCRAIVVIPDERVEIMDGLPG